MHGWGLDSEEPIATAIIARDDADVASIVQSHPDTDFYLPVNLDPALRAAAQNTHEYLPASSGRYFLLAKRSTRIPLRSGMLP